MKKKQLIFYFCVFLFMVYLLLQLGMFRQNKYEDVEVEDDTIDNYEPGLVSQNNPSQIADDMNNLKACQGRNIYYKSADDMSPEVACALNLSSYETKNYGNKGPLFGRTANLEGDMVQDGYCCYDDSITLDNLNNSYNDIDKEKIASFRDYPKEIKRNN